MTFVQLFLKRSKTKSRNPAQTEDYTLLDKKMKGKIVRYKYCLDYSHGWYDMMTAIYLPQGILFGIADKQLFV
ncbi:MAG: hypothetical protein ACK48P_00320, partial [Holosporales bacterium]